ncbi:MAG: UDP-N-acetylmuramoyl-L-alanine--D-glutamate ligase, partial [Bacteroidota bacterium]
MRIGIIGGGESGVGAGLLARREGYEVFVSDAGTIREDRKQELVSNAIRFEEGGHSITELRRVDEVIISPGIPNNAGILGKIEGYGIPVISEIEFASRYCRVPIIAITGTNGKTTTTNLIHHLLAESGVEAVKCGNIGTSWSRQIATRPVPETYVVEISSFQLDRIESFSPDIALLLNITPDHLDRYDGSFESYARSKWRIAKQQTKENPLLVLDELVDRYEPVVENLNGALVRISSDKYKDYFHDLNNQALRGEHNLMNAAFAIEVCLQRGISREEIEAGLRTFRNENHRMQVVRTLRGVEWINDSKATNVHAAYHALEGITKPIVWIAGGVDKGNDYSVLDSLLDERVKYVVSLGVNNVSLDQYVADKNIEIVKAFGMKDAVSVAHEESTSGDAVLLSPCCASFDLFQDYEDRGN